MKKLSDNQLDALCYIFEHRTITKGNIVVHGNTLNSLDNRGLITERNYANGSFYELTKLGNDILETYPEFHSIKYAYARQLKRGNVDLRTCNSGDILISALGAKLTYVRPTEYDEYLDHVVEYTDDGLGTGTRTHDGYVFKKRRIPETDHDIVQIIRKD